MNSSQLRSLAADLIAEHWRMKAARRCPETRERNEWYAANCVRAAASYLETAAAVVASYETEVGQCRTGATTS